MWGTDGIWYGSPQPQIMAFRAFQIGRDHQERFGYPRAHRRGEGQGLRAQRGPPVRPRSRGARCALDRATYQGLVADGAVRPAAARAR